MTKLFNRESEKTRRRSLRNKMPKAEVLLWDKLRNKKLGYRFLRQYSIGKYIIDFYSPTLKLAIEVDGISHFLSDEKVESDKKREMVIADAGIQILRFTNDDIYKRMDGVILSIMNKIESIL